MTCKNGKAYEAFVAEIHEAILRVDETINADSIKIERNKIIEDKNGIKREFDLYWEIKIAGQTYKTVIECKDYSSNISIEKIDAFIGKTDDIPGMKLVYATKTGYQSGAKIKAGKNNISLLVVRGGAEEDWKNDEGISYIKKIIIDGYITTIPRIIRFSPKIDDEWLDNQGLEFKKNAKELLLGGNFKNNEVFIYDKISNIRESLQNYGSVLLKKEKNIEYGEHFFSEKVNDCFLILHYKEKQVILKLSEYNLLYRHDRPINIRRVVDYESQLLGIVHDAIAGDKRRIFRT